MTHLFSDVNAFRRDPLELFKRHSHPDSEPLVRLHLGPSPVYLVTDAALAKAILKADESAIDKGRLVHKLRTVIGTSSITERHGASTATRGDPSSSGAGHHQ